jgi:hypothetical protein
MGYLIAVAVAVAALVVASLIQRRRTPEAPSQPHWTAPSQLDRADFGAVDRTWLVAVFSSATCQTCARVVSAAMVLDSADVGVVEVEFTQERGLHERYHIDAVPTLVIADAAGAVQARFIGPVTATDLWARVAELRQPGSTPAGRGEGCAAHEVS